MTNANATAKAKAPTGKSKPEAAKSAPKAQAPAKAQAKPEAAKAKTPAKAKPAPKAKAPAKGKPEADKANLPAKVEKPDGALPLDTQAKQINANLDKAKFHQDKADDFRLTAACFLADAKKRIEAGELGKVKFLAWCQDNIQRSRADIHKLVKVGNSPDAKKALEDLRAKAKESMQKTRANKKTAPAKITAPAPVAPPAEPAPTFEPGKLPWTETDTVEPAPAPAAPAAPVELDGKEPAPAAPVEEPRPEDRKRLYEAAQAAFNAMSHDGDKRAFLRWAQMILANGNGQGKAGALDMPDFLNRKKS